MDDLQRLLDERACERLTHRYCRYADLGHASRLAELFTSDGVLVLPDRTISGRSEIAAVFAEREALTDLCTVHLCSNLDVEVLDSGRARGWVHLCLYRRWRARGSSGPAESSLPAVVAVYEDEYAVEAGSWLIRSRTQHVLLADPSDPGWTRPGENR